MANCPTSIGIRIGYILTALDKQYKTKKFIGKNPPRPQGECKKFK